MEAREAAAPSSFVKYSLVTTREDLVACLDDVVEGATKMLRKTGQHGQSPEAMLRIIMATVGSPLSFLLLAHDMEGHFVGFIFAVLVPGIKPWVDFVGMWTKPGLASKIKFEAFDLLRAWARSAGAVAIYAGITRHHETFFKWFHEPLGFRKIGVILEYDLREVPADGAKDAS